MKALITGATGFIGGALANALAQDGWDVSVLLRSESRDRLAKPERFEIIEADFAQPETLTRTLSNLDVDVVVHAAAIRNRWGTPPGDYYTVNVASTQALLNTVIGKAKRFIYLSSVGVYGRPNILGIDENTPIQVAAQWDYHSSKAAGEEITLATTNKIEAVVVRPTITYGPGDSDGMVTKLIQMVSNQRFFRIGSGENHIHLTYIDDLIHGLQLAMTHPTAVGQKFVLAGPAPTQMKTILSLIEQETRLQIPKWEFPEGLARFVGNGCEQLFQLLPPPWVPPITRDQVDNLCVNRGFSWDKAAAELGYQPQISIQKGLSQTTTWLASLQVST